MRIHRIKEISEFEPFRQEWEKILDSNATNSVFLSPNFICEWYKYFCDKTSMYLLQVKSNDGLLIGIAPLYLHSESILSVKRKNLRFAGSNYICAEYLDVIIRSGFERQAILTIIDYLDQHKNDWDNLCLTDLTEHSNVLKNIDLFRKLGNIEKQKTRSCLYVSLPKTWEEFQKKLNTKFRKRINYYERRIGREHDVEFGMFNDIEEGMNNLFQLHSARWAEKGILGAFTGSITKRFNMAIANILHENDILRLYFFKTCL